MIMERNPVDELLRRIQGEFLEMPGLTLTLAQASRLWALDTAACSSVVTALVEAQFLYRTHDGRFRRIERGAPAKAALRPQIKPTAAA